MYSLSNNEIKISYSCVHILHSNHRTSNCKIITGAFIIIVTLYMHRANTMGLIHETFVNMRVNMRVICV